jgi:hypothetical protein
MKIVQNQISDYTSINVSTTETAWSSAASYSYGDEVRQGNYIYKYAGDDATNTDENPEIVWERDKNIYSVWVRIKATNYYSALDDKTLTQTINNDNIIIEIDNNRYDTVALLNIAAQSAKVELILNSTQEVYQEFQADLSDRDQRVDAYSHYFTPISVKDRYFVDGIALIPNSTIRITVDNDGGVAAIGRLIVGRSTYVGETLYPAVLDQVTYSRFETDIFGNTNLEQGNTVKLQSYSVIVPTSKIPFLEQKRRELTAIPILFIGDESDDSLLDNMFAYGYFTSAPFNVTNPVKSVINVNIKGLI